MSSDGNSESSTNQSWFTDKQKERAKVAGAWAGAVAGIAVTAWGIFNAFSDSVAADPETDKKEKKVLVNEDAYMYRGDCKKIDNPPHVVAKLSGEPKLVSWKPPTAGTMKVNTDAKCDHTTGQGSYGGVVRNDQGAWVVGFYGKLKGEVTIVQAELEGIYHGLKLIKKRGWSGATVETDSTAAAELIYKKNAKNHSFYDLIEDCIELSRDTGASVAHTLRQGNMCADKMAQLGKLQEMSYVEVEEPPSAIMDLLIADSQGTQYRRDPKKKNIERHPVDIAVTAVLEDK